MKPLAVWLDDLSIASLPGVEQGLVRASATIMRSFSRVPNPAVVAQLTNYRQVAVVCGRDYPDLLARVELATTTLRVGVIAVLPSGLREESSLRGPGLVDVLPALTPGAAGRIKLMSEVPIISGPVRAPRPPAPEPRRTPVGPGPASVGTRPKTDRIELPSLDYRRSERPPIAIASSTGGSWVLADLLRAVDRRRVGPVLLAQHMEAEFIPFFEQWLSSSTGWRTALVSERTALEPECVYLAAGGRDLCVDPTGAHVFAAGASSRFIPCADRLFQTFAKAFGADGVGVVLSGMGADGAAGLAEILSSGGRGLCQLPSSAVVPSMPECALKLAQGAVAVPPGLIAASLLS